MCDEPLFIVFRVTPFSNNIARSLLKEPKIYFFDTGLVKGGEGARFENLVAGSLLKHVYGKIDNLAENYSLHYLQTKERREVDFALIKDDAIERMIEVKLSDATLSSGIEYFHEKYNHPGCQIVKNLRHEKMAGDIPILHAEKFLQSLYL